MTDNRTTELLPCPFCSAKPELWADLRRTWGLVQHEDWCLFPSIRKHEIPEEDFAAWNTRTATTDVEFARAVHDGNLWRRVKGHIRCRNCGLNIESVIALDGCNEHAIKHCPNCGHKVVG